MTNEERLLVHTSRLLGAADRRIEKLVPRRRFIRGLAGIAIGVVGLVGLSPKTGWGAMTAATRKKVDDPCEECCDPGPAGCGDCSGSPQYSGGCDGPCWVGDGCLGSCCDCSVEYPCPGHEMDTCLDVVTYYAGDEQQLRV